MLLPKPLYPNCQAATESWYNHKTSWLKYLVITYLQLFLHYNSLPFMRKNSHYLLFEPGLHSDCQQLHLYSIVANYLFDNNEEEGIYYYLLLTVSGLQNHWLIRCVIACAFYSVISYFLPLTDNLWCSLNNPLCKMKLKNHTLSYKIIEKSSKKSWHFSRIDPHKILHVIS